MLANIGDKVPCLSLTKILFFSSSVFSLVFYDNISLLVFLPLLHLSLPSLIHIIYLDLATWSFHRLILHYFDRNFSILTVFFFFSLVLPLWLPALVGYSPQISILLCSNTHFRLPCYFQTPFQLMQKWTHEFLSTVVL